MGHVGGENHRLSDLNNPDTDELWLPKYRLSEFGLRLRSWLKPEHIIDNPDEAQNMNPT